MRNPKILVVDRDEELTHQLGSVTADIRPRPEIVACERPGAIGDVLDEDGPFDVIVAGPALGTKAGLSRVQAAHDELPSSSVLLAFSKRPDVSLREIVRTGAVDLLHLPVDDESLKEAVERAISFATHRTATTEAVAAATPSTGTVFTVASATGGCGKTFFSTNLAYFLRQHTGKRTCIVDLDLQFGEVSTALRLRPRATISDALQGEEGQDGLGHIEEYVLSHDTGIQVLPAPRDPSEADRINPPDVTRVIEALRSRYDYVVVDTPAALTEIVLAAFDLSDSLYVMATLDLPSVRNMGVFLSTLERLKIPADNINLILNKAESDVGIDVDQVARLFPQGFAAVLPYAREVSKSVNVGTPVLAFSPRSDISRKLAAGLTPLLPEELQAASEAATKQRSGGFFARLFGGPAFRPSEAS